VTGAISPQPPSPDPPPEGGERVVQRHRRLVARTVLVSILTLVSRILGFVREMIMGAIFGDASAVSDAFFTAWRVPNLFRRLLGEGALSTALQTAVTEADADEGDAAGRRLFLRTISLTAWILLGVSAVSMLVVWQMPDQMPLTGWSWLGADPGPVRDLTVRLMPFVVMVCVAALCGGALQVRGHYAAPNLAPSAMNVVWIATLLAVGFAFGGGEGGVAEGLGVQWTMARWLAWGVLAGGVVQLVIHLPPLVRFGLFPGRKGAREGAELDLPPVGAARGRSALRVLRSSAPLALGAAVYQINVMIDGLMAESLLPDGGPTVLYYANRIQQFPLALVAVAATNAVFPSLKALGHTGKLAEMRRLHDRSQLGIAFLAVPAAFGLFALSEPIASVLFQRGNFGPEGVARMSATLEMLAIALVPAGAAGLVGRAYYARGDFRTPVRISCVMLTVNVALNALLVRGVGMDADGLALATALTSWGNLAWLSFGLRERLGLPPSEGGAASRLARVVVASIGSAGAALLARAAVTELLDLDPEVANRSVLALVASGASGIVAYLAAAKLLRIPEWVEFRERVRRRLPSREKT
jgi:putative peptidoglycan lipid II flippase